MLPGRAPLPVYSALCLSMALANGPVEAQAPVTGRVVDQLGQPVAGAVVSAVGDQRRVLSASNGTFVLMLARGAAVIQAQRLGFLPAESRLTVGDSISAHVLLVLRAMPALLKGVSVDAPTAPPLAHTVTSESVRQVPPLLEPDIFRALLFLPGVSQPNDLRGRIHLAGGASDETGVRLDGHPLQDPFHLLGLLGAFNVGALERANVLVHHVPPEAAGHLSGVVALESKAPGPKEGEATVSIISAGATVRKPLPASFDVLASARVSYFRAVAQLAYSDAALTRGDVPLYDMADALLRLGRSSRSGARWEVIGFVTRDVLANGRLRELPGYQPLRWGESLGGARTSVPLGSWLLAARASMNRAIVQLDERAVKLDGDRISTTRDLLSASVTAQRTARRLGTEMGATIEHRTYAQHWRVTEGNLDVFSPRTPNAYAGRLQFRSAAAFATARVNVGAGATLGAGARLWYVAGETYLAPHLLVTLRPGASTGLDLSVERRHQFDAELEEPVEGTVGTPRFPLARPRIANVAAAAVAWRPSAAMELRAHVFAKQYVRDVRLRDALPGVRTDTAGPGFPEFENVRAASGGIGLSGKGAWQNGVAVQGNYSFQVMRDRQAEGWSPSDGDVPHALALFASLPLGWLGMNVSSALQARSGTAVTPVAARVLVPDGDYFRILRSRYLSGSRNSFRLPSYLRLDLGLRRTWTVRRTEATLAVQVLNALVRRNARGISWERYFDELARGSGDSAARALSSVPGLPFLPTVGLEIKW